MKKAYILAFVLLYLKLFSFSFWFQDVTTTFWEEADPLSSNKGFYSLAGCGLSASDISTAISAISPSTSVEDAHSLYFINEISSLEVPHSDGVLIRKESSTSEVEYPYKMVVNLSNKEIIFNTSDFTPTIHDLMHECGHIAGLGHSNIATAIMYDTSTSYTTLHTDDKYGLYSRYCKPDIVESAIAQKYLRGTNENIPISFNSIGKTNPQSYTVDLWDDTPIDAYNSRQHLLSEVTITNQGVTNSNIVEWNSSELIAGLHKLSTYLTGSQDCSGSYPELVSYPQREEPMDELEVMLYNLAFSSPEYNKQYSVFSPLDFKVTGRIGDAVIPITDFESIGSVEYLLENGLGSNVFPLTPTDRTVNFEFSKDLSTISGLSTGTYYVSVYVKDLQGELIAEIIHMPIRIDTRSIQIQDPSKDEFMIYDFDLASWYYTTYFVLAGKFYHEGLANKDIQIPYPAELYDVKWCEDNNIQASVFSTNYPAELRVPDGTYIWSMDKWPVSKTFSSGTSDGNVQYAESYTSYKKTPGKTPEKDEQGVTWYSNTYLNLRPGLYTFLGNMYDKKDYQSGIFTKLADTDTLQFLIPGWKMKTELDMRFGKDRVHFRKGDDIEICIWRPVNGLKANNTIVNLYSENKVQLLQSETISYADSLGITTKISFSTTGLAYGYYTIEAKEIDYNTDREIVYEKEIQVCPFYVRWENEGAWPSDWPGTSDLYWQLTHFSITNPINMSYSMENNYDYNRNVYPLMNVQKTSPSVTLNKPYNAFMQIYIGLERINDIFDELLASYSVSISVNNMAKWDILKTATDSEWATYPWPTTLDRWCFTNTETTINYTNQPIYIKLSGIDQNGLQKDTIFTEGVNYDEIMIAYVKADLVASPGNIKAQFIEAGKSLTVQLTWDHSPDYQTGCFYRVYRDGIMIGNQLTGTNFLDYSTVANRMYNYIVTMIDTTVSDFILCESPKAGHSINFFTGLSSPSNLVIIEENPNIRLTWSPVSGSTGYKVYSSTDPYGTFSENTTGTFNGEEWVAPLTESKLFYYVVAVNESMKEKKVIKEKIIIKTSGNQVK